MEIKKANRFRASAMVLDVKKLDPKPDKPQRARVSLQVIGGGCEDVFPTLDDLSKMSLKINGLVEVDIAYEKHSSGESKRGQYTDRFDLFRCRVFLPTPGVAA